MSNEVGFEEWETAEQLCNDHPHIFSRYGLKQEASQREVNGMSECGAVMLYRKRLLFHRSRMLQWFESRNTG